MSNYEQYFMAVYLVIVAKSQCWTSRLTDWLTDITFPRDALLGLKTEDLFTVKETYLKDF